MSPLLLIAGLITGTMIGTFGVGGVLLAPFLFYGLGIELHLATAMSSWSFLFTGIVGTFVYWRMGNISWDVVGWLTVGIVPGAVLGARANVAVSSTTLVLLLATLVLASGLNILFSRSGAQRQVYNVGRRLLVLLGFFTGLGSALTGTGGPMLLVPVLMFINVPALAAIAASQVVQVPVAAAATIGFGLFGEVDLVLGTMLGVVQSVGVVIGARIAHAVDPNQLRRIVAIALVAVAIIMISRILIST